MRTDTCIGSRIAGVVLLLALGSSSPVMAEEAKEKGKEKTKSNTELAKATQNPLADIVTLPLQNNTDFLIGPNNDQVANTFNIQPVFPFNLGPMNLISRLILPIVYRPEAMTGVEGGKGGLGDLTIYMWFGPSKASKVIWGIGPVLTFPTATSAVLGSQKFGLGPTGVLVVMLGKWVFGALVQHVWSYVGNPDRDDINMTLVQYFVNFNLPNGWYLSSAPILTGNWKIEQGNKWTVPFGLGAGKVFRAGKLPINIQLAGFYNAVKPDEAAEFSIRFQINFILPKFY